MKTILIAIAACAPLIALAAPSVNLVDISKPGVPGKTFAASTSMPASLSSVCAAIQDFAAYPQFMPNVDKIKVASSSGGASLVDVTLKLPMGKIKQYRLKMTPKVTDVSCQLAWKLVPVEGLKPDDTIADTSGYWQLSPEPQDAGATAIKYQVYTDPGPVLLHCLHGADRTGMMTAMYRMLYQGWPREKAIDELKNGGYGYHAVWKNIEKYLKRVDVDAIRAQIDQGTP